MDSLFLRHLRKKGLGPFPDLFVRQVLLVRRDRSQITERILDLTHAVSPKHIGHRQGIGNGVLPTGFEPVFMP